MLSDIWNVSYIELRILKSSKLWSSQLWTQFKQLRIEAWKSQDFSGVWTCDLLIPVRRSNQLSYVSGFIAQLVTASHRYREVTGSNPVEVQAFIRNCLNCVHNGDDQSLLELYVFTRKDLCIGMSRQVIYETFISNFSILMYLWIDSCRKNYISSYIWHKFFIQTIKCSFFSQIIIVYPSFYGTLLKFSYFLFQGKVCVSYASASHLRVAYFQSVLNRTTTAQKLYGLILKGRVIKTNTRPH